MAASSGLNEVALAAYFVLMEVSSLVRHAVEQHLRAAGDLSYVQFQVLARLSDAPAGTQRMTDLADGLVDSRSGLTYQAGLLEKAGLITRAPSADDERSVMVSITDEGRAVLARVFPGPLEVVRRLLFEALSSDDVQALTRMLTPVREHIRRMPGRSARRAATEGVAHERGGGGQARARRRITAKSSGSLMKPVCPPGNSTN